MAWDSPRRIPNLEYAQFDIRYTDAVSEGKLQWNSEDGTLEYGLPGGNVVLQIGQEQLVRCSNKSGVEIGNGKVVYVTGAQGNRPTIALARADQALGTGVPLGIATETIAHNASGYVNVGGLVRDMDTSGIPAGGLGFLSEATAGEIRTTPPAAPNFTTVVGYSLFQNADSGIFFVRVLSAPALTQLTDVNHTTPNDGDILVWDIANLRWNIQAPA